MSMEESNMSETGEPIRLRRLAARGSVLERGLEAAQASGPTQEQLQALERRVLAGLGATAVASAAVTMAKTAGAQGAGAAAGWLSAGSAKLVVALVATVTVGGGSVAVWHAATTRASMSAAASTPTPSQAALPRHAVTGAVSGAVPLAPEPIVSGSARPELTTLSGAKARLARPALAPPPAGASFRHVEVARAVSGQSDHEPADEELSLLARANHALAKSPAFALTLADEHTRRFPDSGMDQERELIAITALVDLGQTGEAQRRAARFSRAHPGSVYQGRIEKALAPHR